MTHDVFPFSAIVGQERLKLALILNAINPGVGGVLIRGEKGTAKSTSVRALASLLPPVRVVKGCPWSCDPDDGSRFCPACREKFSGSAELESGEIGTPVVTLPLNATEDRVTGGIDFSSAVKSGKRTLQPGLLARAHRGVLYVDEVNLLDDHIVDIILDAASSGENRIEREGLSFCHKAGFILVGTMNPEEGELRPQLLDRFGLCVEVGSEQEIEKRIVLMERKEAHDRDKKGFQKIFHADDLELARRIARAKKQLPHVRFSTDARHFSASLCSRYNVAGHRADLVIEQAARALAAYHGKDEADFNEINRIAELVLAHRKRDPVPPPPPEESKEDGDKTDENEKQDEDSMEHSHPETEESPELPEEQGTEENESEENEHQPADEEQDGSSSGEPDKQEDDRGKDEILEKIFETGETFKVRKFSSPRDRIFRRGSGRRSRTRTDAKQGRYVKSTLSKGTGDIAFDATLRAAAPYQLQRKQNGCDLAVALEDRDIREKIREKRTGNFLLFLVDASASMGARGRMRASKGAVMSLLLDAYQKRDKVAMVSFRKEEAVVNLPPTSSVELAGKMLEEMPVGGKTPLSSGLVKAFEILRSNLVRDPDTRPLVIIITDGRGNVSLGEKKPFQEALDLAGKMSLEDRIRFVLVDSESRSAVSFGLAHKLAARLNAQYFKIHDLKADQLVGIAKGGLH